MLQALAGVNPQVKILVCSHLVFLVGNSEISTNNRKKKEGKEEKKEAILQGLEYNEKHNLIKQALQKLLTLVYY